MIDQDTVMHIKLQCWKYFDYLKATVDSVVRPDGSIKDYDPEEYNIDEVQEGRMLLLLYKETGEEKYRKAAQLVLPPMSLTLR